MRILHIVNDAETGGAQTLIEALALHGSSEDQLHVIVLLDRGGLSDRLEAAAASVEYVGMTRRDVLPHRAVRSVLRAVRRHRIDVVHSHLHQSDVVNALTPHGRPRLSTQHSETDNSSSRVAALVWRTAAKLSFRMDAVVACSPAAREITGELGYTFPAGRIPVIVNGTTPGEEPDADPESGMLLNLARFAPAKDHRTLLAAMALVRATHPGTRLLCAGHGVSESNEQLVSWRREFALEDAVELAGTITDVRSRMRAASALVFSSRSEALPMAGLEAISVGLPVITTRAGDTALMTVSEHLVCSPRDPEALAQAIRWFLDRSADERTLLRKRSWELARRRFDIRGTVDGYRAVYSDLVG